MNTYRVIQRIDTWATIEVNAETAQEAITLAETDPDLDWSYDTDFDSATTVNWDLISENPEPVLMDVEFVDPYLGRDDVVWQVSAYVDSETVEATIISSNNEDDLGTRDQYTTDEVRAYR